MKALVVYDSQFGNTEAIARAIAEPLGAEAVRPESVNPAALHDLDLLVVGAPTQAGRPTPAVKKLLDGIPPDGLDHVDVAAFDTRIDASCAGFIGRVAMKLFGFAAPRIEHELEAKGGHAVGVEGFYVLDKEGPLRPEELERATAWAQSIPRAA